MRSGCGNRPRTIGTHRHSNEASCHPGCNIQVLQPSLGTEFCSRVLHPSHTSESTDRRKTRQAGGIVGSLGVSLVSSSRADVLLHPVRLRIVQAVAAGRRLTAQEIGHVLKDVPQASLYRHLNKLVEEGFLHVVEERPVGGATERVYAIVDGQGVLPVADLEKATKADHMRYFAAFCAMLMSKFDRYLEREHVDFVADGVGYRVYSLYLSDEEFQQFIKAINEPFAAVATNEPAPGRRRRMLATVVMPDEEIPEPGDQ